MLPVTIQPRMKVSIEARLRQDIVFASDLAWVVWLFGAKIASVTAHPIRLLSQASTVAFGTGAVTGVVARALFALHV